jgi:hypothetical protein
VDVKANCDLTNNYNYYDNVKEEIVVIWLIQNIKQIDKLLLVFFLQQILTLNINVKECWCKVTLIYNNYCKILYYLNSVGENFISLLNLLFIWSFYNTYDQPKLVPVWPLKSRMGQWLCTPAEGSLWSRRHAAPDLRARFWILTKSPERFCGCRTPGIAQSA